MSYEAIVYNIMIASPGDVDKEREVVRTVINEWNILHSESTGRVFLPVDWENHSSPLQGERAQKIINDQVLKKADLLIGIFWNRVGTPTGDSLSGTVEEIDKHVQSGKPAMLYFSNKPSVYNKDSQREQVEELKLKYQQKGLTCDFKSTKEFEDHLKKHLTLTFNNLNLFPSFKGTIPYFIKINSPKTKYFSDFNTQKSDSNKNTISESAKELLLKMSKSNSGQLNITNVTGSIKIYSIMGQLHIQTKSNRDNEKWNETINELETMEFIYSTGNDNLNYKISQKGYNFVDSLE